MFIDCVNSKVMGFVMHPPAEILHYNKLYFVPDALHFFCSIYFTVQHFQIQITLLFSAIYSSILFSYVNVHIYYYYTTFLKLHCFITIVPCNKNGNDL